MSYRLNYAYQGLGLKIDADSKRLRGLIEDVLDLDRGVERPRADITIRIRLREAGRKGSLKKTSFARKNAIDAEGALCLSLEDKAIAYARADAGKATVEARIVKFEESRKERIIDLILMQPIRFIIARRGFYFLHASSVGRGKGCVVINGSQGSGKSTLAAVLARSGFDFLADDDCYLRIARNRVSLSPFPTKMGLHDNLFKRYPDLGSHISKKALYGGRPRISARAAFGDPGDVRGYDCRLVLFPEYARRKRSGIVMRGISDEDALGRLCATNRAFYDKETCRSIFWVFHALLKQAEPYTLRYNDGDLGEVPAAVERILGRHPSGKP